MPDDYDKLEKRAMRVWARLYDAHQGKRGARISFKELELLVAIDGHVIQRFGDVESMREEKANRDAEMAKVYRLRRLSLPGLQDKLYWREVRGGQWHCFKKNGEGTFTSLCGRHDLSRSGGQAIDRPHPWQRCGLCDGREMQRRGWNESGPTRRAR